jgi:hypothetical protein
MPLLVMMFELLFFSGQFAPASGGEFKLARDSQFDRFLQSQSDT